MFDFGVDTIIILVDQLHLGYLGDGLLNGVVRRAINRLLGGDFIGLTTKRAFRFLDNVFGYILDNLDPFNLFPLKEPIESNPTRNYDLLYKFVCSFRASVVRKPFLSFYIYLLLI